MKKIKISVVILTLALIFGLAGSVTSIKAEAAVNVVKKAKTVKSTSGSWKQNYIGRWFQYKNGTYPKNKWIKIKNKIYYFDKSGYVTTGWKYYKKSYYYLNETGSKKGALVRGWKTINGKRYYLSKTTGAMYTGWHTIGGKKYYFDKKSSNLGAMVKKRWVNGRYLQKDGTMAVNCKAGKYYVGADGKKTKAPQEPENQNPENGNSGQTNQGPNDNAGSSGVKQYNTYVFVGDSRTVGMENVIGSKDGNAQYIAKVGEGYNWLMSSGLTQLKKKLDFNPYVKVVFNLGVNDCASNTVLQYINVYQELIASYPNTKFYMMSVNPVNDKVASSVGYLIKNKHITPFNMQLKAAFPNLYIDTYTYLKTNGFGTADGVHYDNDTYQAIYDYTMSHT
ncbi:hypothetical protein [Robinsoniella peoriensis]|uniref:hypothetical protein n=1 Tax=Robinsoniella peoriensis TaxID=180332 RepID=UPI0037529BE8